jgi:hypothetical protein
VLQPAAQLLQTPLAHCWANNMKFLNTVLSKVSPFEGTRESVWKSSRTCKNVHWTGVRTEATAPQNITMTSSGISLCLCQYRTDRTASMVGRPGKKFGRNRSWHNCGTFPYIDTDRLRRSIRHQSVIYSFIPPMNAHLTNKNIFLYCRYIFRHYIRHLQGALRWNLKFTEI